MAWLVEAHIQPHHPAYPCEVWWSAAEGLEAYLNRIRDLYAKRGVGVKVYFTDNAYARLLDLSGWWEVGFDVKRVHALCEESLDRETRPGQKPTFKLMVRESATASECPHIMVVEMRHTKIKGTRGA